MKKTALACLVLAGCATNSGVVPIGPDSYLVSRQAGTGAGGLGTLKVEAIQEANQFCAKSGKIAQITSSSENSGPFILGNFPKAEVWFTCVARPA